MAHAAIAIDLGGTQVRAGLISDKGELLFHASQRTRANDGPDAVLSQIKDLVTQIRVAMPCADSPIGVSAPGPLDTRTGVVCGLQSLRGFEGFPLWGRLEDCLAAKIVLENDGIAGAIGEWRHGAGRGCLDLLYVTLSTGVGGGIIAGGRPLRGHRGLAGHVGHIFFAAEGPRYPGGRMTCFEDYASASALAYRASLKAREEPGSSLSTRDMIDARAATHAAREGDPLALSLMRDQSRMVGIGLASLAHVLNPERILIGGGLSAAFEQMADDIRMAFAANAKPGFGMASIDRAGLAEHSCLYGAASLALDPSVSDLRPDQANSGSFRPQVTSAS